MRGAGWEDSHWLQVRGGEGEGGVQICALIAPHVTASPHRITALLPLSPPPPPCTALHPHRPQDQWPAGSQQGDRHSRALPRRGRRHREERGCNQDA